MAAATFALAAALPAAASSVLPANPTAFERVDLRMSVDSCVFNPSTVRVRAAGNVLRVTQQPNACLVPGPVQEVDVRLGSLAAGDYSVEVYASPDAGGEPVERLAFEVRDPVEPAVFPPPPRPLTDYTGIWWNPLESGWGLSLHQSAMHGVFGAFFVYGASGEPEWFTLQGGQWLDSVTWRGTVYRTTGPFFAGPDYDPRLVLVQAAGTATLDFRIRPGESSTARFTYTISGATTTKPIARMAF
ncbi:MAG TPA: hypothetical protein VEC19_18380 [Usitatibacter sp.]|nr:hypothetical protein [Usitatibacter sp.]